MLMIYNYAIYAMTAIKMLYDILPLPQLMHVKVIFPFNVILTIVDIAIIYGLGADIFFSITCHIEEYSTFHAFLIYEFVVIIIGLFSQFHLLLTSLLPHNNKPERVLL